VTCQFCSGPLTIAAKGPTPKFCSTKCRVYFHRANRLPVELTSRHRWVRRNAQKVPLTIEGRAASSTNPKTWTSYKKAAASNIGVGLGFVLGDGIGCIDLDHCINEGVVTEWAREILHQVGPTYVEVSPSGEGLHLWGYLEEAPGIRRKGVEVYSVGRYITITGKVFMAAPLRDLPSLGFYGLHTQTLDSLAV
jgi:primase-polymerase (primpol)-like protein